MQGQEKHLHGLLEPGVRALGYELLGVKFFRDHSPAVLRLYIDHDNGIGVDDCAAVSHQVSGTLDVEDAIRENYSLEVSSPGADRPLFCAEHFQRFRGEQVKLRLLVPLEGRRNFRGRLLGVSDADVVVEVDGIEQRVPLNNIATARLVPAAR